MTKKEREEKAAEGLKDMLEKMQQTHSNQMVGAAKELYIMYESYQKAGFTKKEAFELVKLTVSATIDGIKR